MASVANEVSRIRDNGWRQGSILPLALTSQLRDEKLLGEVEDGDLFIVLSHDCDVTNYSLAVEPYCEIVRVRYLSQEEKEGNRFWGKNPRTYQFSDASSGGDGFFEVSIQDIAKVSRLYLAEMKPDCARSISVENIRGICRWISRRYIRASFPDAFNERAEQAIRRFRQSLKSKGHLLEGFYVLVSDDELPTGQDYDVVVWVTMRDESYNDPQARTEAQKLVDAIEAQLAACDGIVIKAFELRSEADVSLSDIRKLKRWDFDDLSLRAGPEASLPPAD